MTPELSDILKWIVLLIILLLLYRSMMELSEKSQREHDRAYSGRQGQRSRRSAGRLEPFPSRREDQDDEGLREWQEMQEKQSRKLAEEQRKREFARKSGKIRKILQRDPDMASDLSQIAGTKHLPANQLLDNPSAIEKIANQLSDEILDILDVATQSVAVDIDLQSGSIRKEVTAGGQVAELKRIRSAYEAGKIRPIEHVYPPNLKSHRLATGQAKRIQRYEIVQKQKLLVVLEDGSGSMNDPMEDGRPRYVWSRGVIVKLARMAVNGKTRFVYRMFDSAPHQAIKATTPKEARQFLRDTALKIAPSGGGTNIFNAFSQAVKDIASDKQITEADILIVSDGADLSMNDVPLVKKMLGKKTKLHVIMIGGENESLKKVAASYQVFR